MKTIRAIALALMAVCMINTLSGFKPIENKAEELYIYLSYDYIDVNKKTAYLIVSDPLLYSDWEENAIEIKKKFKAEAAGYSEVSTYGIEQKGLAYSIDDVKIERAEYVKSFKSWQESHYKNKAVIHYVNLYRL
ncbi:hypothetical protein [Parapedobacter sp. DT-150]|uniref:hypothetical protein n=1 Tax=Parapedobacter sp. DT-150 TaxID=3396162 RepID=UPI003F1A50B4